MIREYERSSGATYPDDLKIAAVVSALPSELRTHVQMALQDTTTFDDLRQRLELYEQASTKWTADSTLQSAAVKPAVTDSGSAVPMEVDAISWGKDGGKKGKKGGKKGWQSKGKAKGKPSWSKDGGKKGKKGKSPGKQGKGKGGVSTCHNCGKTGRYARDCWALKKIGKVEESSEIDVKSSASQASTGSASTSAAPRSVKRVRLVTPPGLSTLEIFDLTEGDAEDSSECEKDDYAAVCMVKEAQFDSEFEDCEEEPDEFFFECFENFGSPLPSSTIWLADGFPGDDFQQVLMVKEVPFYDNVTMTLDSGADVSVAPPEYYQLGEPGLSRAVHMIDAQGERIKTPGNRRLRLVAKTKHGEEIEFVENFAFWVKV